MRLTQPPSLLVNLSSHPPYFIVCCEIPSCEFKIKSIYALHSCHNDNILVNINRTIGIKNGSFYWEYLNNNKFSKTFDSIFESVNNNKYFSDNSSSPNSNSSFLNPHPTWGPHINYHFLFNPNPSCSNFINNFSNNNSNKLYLIINTYNSPNNNSSLIINNSNSLSPPPNQNLPSHISHGFLPSTLNPNPHTLLALVTQRSFTSQW